MVNSVSTATGPAGWAEKLLGFIDLRPRAAILLVCLVGMIPGFFTTPPLDRDESRYAQASRQMMETGDFVEIRFQDTARNKKPVGIYWLQVASASLFGGENAPIWAYRIPSLIGAVGAAFATWWAGLALFGRREAILGAVILGACLSAVVEAHIAKTDAFLLLTVVLAQGALARIYVSHKRGTGKPHWGLTTIFWLAQGVGILIKGPITPMVSALTILMLMIWDRDVKWAANLRPLTGLVIAAVVAAPWLIAIYIATDGAFFADAIGGDMGGKVTGGAEQHWGIPGYHLLFLSFMFWPAAFAVWPAIRNAWDARKVDAIRFCIAWIIPTWLVFEALPTKLPHYVLPTYPALALLVTAFVFGKTPADFAVWRKTGVVLWAVVTAALAVAAVFVPAVYGNGVAWAVLPLTIVILAGTYVTIREGWRAASPRGLVMAIVVGLLTMATVFHLTLPRLTDLDLSRRLAAAVERVQPDDSIPVFSSGYSEPSLVFVLGTHTIFGSPVAAADHLAEHPGAVVLLVDNERRRSRFITRALELGLIVEANEVVDGFNYSGGDRLRIKIYQVINAPEALSE